MIIDNLNLNCIAVCPFEADSPLLVDPDAPLPAARSTQLLEMIRRRNSQVIERNRAMKHAQLSERDLLNLARQSPGTL